MARWRLPLMPRFGRDIWLLGAAAALMTGGNLGTMQLLKVMYVLRLGFGPEYIGAVFATGSLAFSLSSLPAAALGSRFGPRRMLLAGGVVMVLGMAILPLTEFVPPALRAFWPMLVQLISSAGWSAVQVNLVTALVALTTPENRKGAYALREAAAGLGMFLGTFFGGLLPAAFAGLMGLTTESPVPYRYGLIVAVMVCAVGLIPLVLVKPVPPAPRAAAGKRSWRPLLVLAPLLVCGFLNNGAVASCKAFAYAYMDRQFLMPTAQVGVIASLGMFVAIFGALSSTRLARRQGSGLSMMVASIGLALSMLVMGLIPHWTAGALGTIGQFALSAMFMPAYQVLQMELAAPEWRWLAAGAGNMSMSLGFGAVSLTGGYVVAAYGYRTLFVEGALLALASAFLVWATLLRRRPAPAAARSAPKTA